MSEKNNAAVCTAENACAMCGRVGPDVWVSSFDLPDTRLMCGACRMPEKPAEVCGPENQNPPMCTSFGWSPAEARGGEFMCWLDAIENPENPGRSVYVGEMYGNTAAEAEARADMVCRAVNGHSGLLAALALIVETKDRGGDLLAVIDAARTHLA